MDGDQAKEEQGKVRVHTRKVAVSKVRLYMALEKTVGDLSNREVYMYRVAQKNPPSVVKSCFPTFGAGGFSKA